MTRALLAAICLTASLSATAKEGAGTMHFRPDLSNQASLQRGARLFVNYCLSCHSAAYMRFNRLGLDLDIPEDLLISNMMFGTTKTGDTMTVAMNPDDAQRWFGVSPPDLSVVARPRGPDWLYTYFMTFYRDPTRPTGVNNLAFKDVAMPHVLWELQGWQRAVHRTEGEGAQAMQVIDYLEQETPGKLSAGEYASSVKDLVNFLVYLGEPIQLKRYTIGMWVIAYLLFLFVVVYLLKREYWSDVH